MLVPLDIVASVGAAASAEPVVANRFNDRIRSAVGNQAIPQACRAPRIFTVAAVVVQH